jgi:hypothetical protein
MDADTVREMLLRNLGRAADDPVGSHGMYDDDAVLEFPQSGERFVGVANIRVWRSRYPGSVTYDIRRIRGADDMWVAEMAMTAANRASESTFSRSGTARSCARRSMSANRSTRPSGGQSGGSRRNRLTGRRDRETLSRYGSARRLYGLGGTRLAGTTGRRARPASWRTPRRGYRIARSKTARNPAGSSRWTAWEAPGSSATSTPGWILARYIDGRR